MDKGKKLGPVLETARLRLRVPVYMVFSKADQLTGYSEYFDDLDAEARAQAWGMTFPLARGVDLFASEFRLLLERLERRLFERLQAERAVFHQRGRGDVEVGGRGFDAGIAVQQAHAVDQQVPEERLELEQLRMAAALLDARQGGLDQA